MPIAQLKWILCLFNTFLLITQHEFPGLREWAEGQDRPWYPIPFTTVTGPDMDK